MLDRLRRWLAPPPERPSLLHALGSITIPLAALGFAAWVGLYPEWVIARSWTEHSCVVVDKRVAEMPSEGGGIYRPELLLEYTVNGAPYRQWSTRSGGNYSSGPSAKHAAIAPFVIGQSYPCWYDPADPSNVVALRGYLASGDEWLALFVFIPGLILASGVRSLYYYLAYRGLTPLQIAARVDGAGGIVPSNATGDPTVPTPRHGRGRVLPYRLTPEHDLGWSFLFLVVFAILWGILPVGFFVAAIRAGFGAGVAVSALFLVPLVYMLGSIAHRLLAHFGIRPTDIEISQHPLYPGDTFQVLVSQRGRLRLTSLLVDLLCEEEVRYGAGTDVRTETHVVFRRRLFTEEHLAIPWNEPLTMQTSATIPPGAMHSFDAPNNAVTWKILVKGDVPNFPDLERKAALVVAPPRPALAGGYRQRGGR